MVVEDRDAVVELVVDDGGFEGEVVVEVVPPAGDVVEVELASVDEVELDVLAPATEDDDVVEVVTVVDVDVGPGAEVVVVVLVEVVPPPPLGALVDQAPE